MNTSQPIFEVFYDGDCPLCKREIGMLRRLDRRRWVRFTDIADPAFRARLSSDGSEVIFNTPAEFKAMLPGEVEKYRVLIQQLGIKLE